MRIRARMDRFASNWIRRRQGPDRGAVTLRRGRIYILPTGLGAAFGLMLLAMLLGSLNYANNMGLALTFLLAALGVAAMHACHRNLESLVARAAGAEPPYAGNDAVFRIAVSNPGRAPRSDLEAVAKSAAHAPLSVAAGGESVFSLRVPTRRRGSVVLDRVEIATRFPYGLFRAWAVLHPAMPCLVYPRPAADSPMPPQAPGLAGGGTKRRGEDDLRGSRIITPAIHRVTLRGKRLPGPTSCLSRNSAATPRHCRSSTSRTSREPTSRRASPCSPAGSSMPTAAA